MVLTKLRFRHAEAGQPIAETSALPRGFIYPPTSDLERLVETFLLAVSTGHEPVDAPDAAATVPCATPLARPLDRLTARQNKSPERVAAIAPFLYRLSHEEVITEIGVQFTHRTVAIAAQAADAELVQALPWIEGRSATNHLDRLDEQEEYHAEVAFSLHLSGTCPGLQRLRRCSSEDHCYTESRTGRL